MKFDLSYSPQFSGRPLCQSEITYQEHLEPLERLLRLSKLPTALQRMVDRKVAKAVVNDQFLVGRLRPNSDTSNGDFGDDDV